MYDDNQMYGTQNPNGTTTYRITGLQDWWTTDEAEVKAMVKQYDEIGSWEERGTK